MRRRGYIPKLGVHTSVNAARMSACATRLLAMSLRFRESDLLYLDGVQIAVQVFDGRANLLGVCG